MASEKVSRKMVLEIKYVNANNAVIHTENLVTGILAKISLGTGIWAKFRLGTGIWYPPFTTLSICIHFRVNIILLEAQFFPVFSSTFIQIL